MRVIVVNNPWCSHSWRVFGQCQMGDLGTALPPWQGNGHRLCCRWCRLGGAVIIMDIKFISCTYFCLQHPPPKYICIKLLLSVYSCHYSGKCKRCEHEGSPRFALQGFNSLFHFTCMWACVWARGCRKWEWRLVKQGMDCFNHRVMITPTSSTPASYMVYNMTVCLPLLFCLLNSSLSYYVFVGGHSLSLCLSGNL